MDATRFDAITRSLTGEFSRRGGLGVLAAAAFGLAAAHLPAATVAKKGKKGKKGKKKPPFNEFGCLDVGVRCDNANQCCSGICAPNTKKKKKGKGKKGKKPRKFCQAHHTGGCLPGQTPVDCGGAEDVDCLAGAPRAEGVFLQGTCFTTTGNAGFCATAGICGFPCLKDRDCQDLEPDIIAACAVCPDCAGGTGCVAAVG